MKILKKIFNRYNILFYIIIILMFALSFRLATLTIVEGDYYRDVSDNKRLKEVYTTAPRGEIRDRYGKLLAGNLPSFTVQILKDELNIKDKEKKNNAILSLIRLLEEDGVDYLSEYPVGLNEFKFKTEEDYLDADMSPTDRVIEIIINENLLAEVFQKEFNFPNYEEHFKFNIRERALNILEKDEDIQLTDEEIINTIDNDKTIIRKIIDHPISREIVYNVLKELELEDNIIMEEYTISFDEEYKEQKRSLMKLYEEISFETKARDDLINIVMKEALNDILETVIIKESNKGKEEIIVPAQILLDMINEKEKIPIVVDFNEEKTDIILRYTGETEIVDKTPLEILIDYGKKTNTLGDFITSDSIKSIAQEQLLIHGINTRISIANDFEYTPINNKNRWYDENGIKEELSPEAIFDKIRSRYEIPEKLSKYEAKSILGIYELLNKQGHLAYQPINIAYNIKNSTVARIEEGLGDLPGIQVSIEPVRYYPEGERAAHILGYLGKISQANEIERYVNESGYSPNDIIGKTGIEESFEEELRGKNGIKRVEVDVLGNTTKVIDEKKPKPGNNVYLSIDFDLQEFVEESLKYTLDKIQTAGTYESPWGNYKFDINKSKRKPYENATSGSVVVLDVKTGEVLSMVSYPAFDPNLFSTGISQADWLNLFPENDKDPLAARPLYNVSTQTAVQPGSTFKMVTALAGLEKGISPTKGIRDMGYVDLGSYKPACWIWNQSRGTHGYENVYEAIRDSCNYYFYSLAFGRNPRTGENIGGKVEIEDIVELSKQLGLNDKTGIEINIPAEFSGGVPNPQRKIVITKSLLKSYLRQNINGYIKEDLYFEEIEITDIIEDIISWTELEEPLTRGQVVNRLDAHGIDPERRLPGEREGLADKIKYTYLNHAGWNITDTLNVTIGQGQNSYTPIQMTKYIATIANGGYRYETSLIDNIKNYNNSKVLYNREPRSEKIELNNYENLDHIKLGMLKVTTEGTARRTFAGLPVKVGAKTGTAQRSGTNPYTGETYDDFAWFVAFAPYDEPEIAIASVIFQGGSGGYAGPMVRDIIAEYLGLNDTGTKGSLPFINTLTR